MKNISEILKNAREDLELTQIDVMKKTGINNKTLSGYENGISEPDLGVFSDLLRLYNLSADEVLEIHPDKNRRCIYLNTEEYQLLQCFRKLDSKQKADFLVMLAAVSSQREKNE